MRIVTRGGMFISWSTARKSGAPTLPPPGNHPVAAARWIGLGQLTGWLVAKRPARETSDGEHGVDLPIIVPVVSRNNPPVQAEIGQATAPPRRLQLVGEILWPSEERDVFEPLSPFAVARLKT